MKTYEQYFSAWPKGGFFFYVTKCDSKKGSHQGQCYDDIKEIHKKRYIRRQLKSIPDDILILALTEHGAWEDDELKDRIENEFRLLWLACCGVSEDIFEKENGR